MGVVEPSFVNSSTHPTSTVHKRQGEEVDVVYVPFRNSSNHPSSAVQERQGEAVSSTSIFLLSGKQSLDLFGYSLYQWPGRWPPKCHPTLCRAPGQEMTSNSGSLVSSGLWTLSDSFFMWIDFSLTLVQIRSSHVPWTFSVMSLSFILSLASYTV